MWLTVIPAELSLMLEVSKIQEHAEPKPQKLYPRVKKGRELWGDHKQIRILLPFPNPLLITKYLLYDFGEMQYCASSFQPLIPWTEWSRMGRQNTSHGQGRQLSLILLGNKENTLWGSRQNES